MYINTPVKKIQLLCVTMYAGGSESSQNSGIILVQRICKETNLVTLKVLPFCTHSLAPVVLPLLEAPLQVLIWYGSETCCHSVELPPEMQNNDL